jgi:hypothetical protein
MAWVTKIKQRDGRESVLGFHMTHLEAVREADEFNRRYQTDSAHVEPFDSKDASWPTAGGEERR